MPARGHMACALALAACAGGTFSPPFGATGPLGDSMCNMETVDEANASQLYALLAELSETTFFRLLHVDMDTPCQYWGAGAEEASCGSDDDVDADDHAAPLCSIGASDAPADPFGAGGGGGDPFGGDAFGGESGLGAEYSGAVDETLTPEEEHTASTSYGAEDCTDEELPSFWLDMCSNIVADDKAAVVNLQLNPERYTGYNGSHIWRAIYHENCLQRTGSEDNICYEERVLYRLLSGMHAATNTHIARHYHAPSKRHNRTEWTPNLDYFAAQFASNPERLKNLHFAFVVLLRAVRRAAPYLSAYQYTGSGDAAEDARTAELMRRLLGTSILRSCEPLFEAFDEGMLFREAQAPWWSLKKQFKGVFHNISKVIDCVSCSKCRLHAKVTMLGLGTALKMLLLPEDLLATAVSQQEVVALVNTLTKFSTAIHYVKEMTQLQYARYFDPPADLAPKKPAAAVPAAASAPAAAREERQQPPAAPAGVQRVALTAADRGATDGSVHGGVAALMDEALRHIAALSRAGAIAGAAETAAVARALDGDARLLLLARHFGPLPSFARHVSAILPTPAMPLDAAAAAGLAAGGAGGASSAPGGVAAPDVLVVGSGAAGLVATLRLLDAGATVTLLDKEKRIGGNSAKASSGINGCCPPHSRTPANAADSVSAFADDTARSARRSRANNSLLELVTSRSEGAIRWLTTRTRIDLSKVAQLGGHSHARTHRPSNGMIGAEIIFALQKEVRKFEASGRLTMLLGCRATALVQDGAGGVVGVRYARDGEEGEAELRASQTVLATGGFANDRTATSLLKAHRADLVSYPTTNGEWATGDGLKMAAAIGAGTVDMEHVQVHPTGFVDPADVGAPTKVLCGEMMRGVGGILLAPDGRRFVNELAPRDKVVAAESATGASEFVLLLNGAAALEAGKHVELYTRKGLLTMMHGTAELAAWMVANGVRGAPADASELEAALNGTLAEYNAAAARGSDGHGKSYFHNAPLEPSGALHAGRIVPVLHYTMGGLTIDAEGRVLRPDGSAIRGLSAAGEVTGGVHGENRLGGNSLLECTVVGGAVGDRLGEELSAQRAELAADDDARLGAPPLPADGVGECAQAAEVMTLGGAVEARRISRDELAQHCTADDCWVALHGKVYDLTDFADEHPAGAASITCLAGTDGTAAFDAVHNEGMLAEFEPDLVGTLADE